MNLLSIDCEFNQPSGKTIQIGAVVVNTAGLIIDRFETFVDPEENLNPDIVKLCDIHDRDLAGAPKIKEAFEMLEFFHAKNKCFTNPLVWGSGVRNDSLHIYEESGIKDRLNFMGYRVIDVKSIFQSVMMVQGKTVRGGLAKACSVLGIGFEGRPHGALPDAHNTARVFFNLMKAWKK